MDKAMLFYLPLAVLPLLLIAFALFFPSCPFFVPFAVATVLVLAFYISFVLYFWATAPDFHF